MKTFTASTEDEKETLQNLKLNELNNRLKRIVQSTRSLAACSSFDQTIQQFLAEIAQNVGSRGGSIYLVKNGSLVLQTALDPGHAELSFHCRPRRHRFSAGPLTENRPFWCKILPWRKTSIPADGRNTRMDLSWRFRFSKTRNNSLE